MKSSWQPAVSAIVRMSHRISGIEYDFLAERDCKELCRSFGSSASFSHTNYYCKQNLQRMKSGDKRFIPSTQLSVENNILTDIVSFVIFLLGTFAKEI